MRPPTKLGVSGSIPLPPLPPSLPPLSVRQAAKSHNEESLIRGEREREGEGERKSVGVPPLSFSGP